MKKVLSAILFFFLAIFYLQAQPAEYSENCGLTQKEFFEQNHRKTWEQLSEMEQFAIACSSNIFQRNKQYHLDFSNRIVFSEKTRKGIEVLNENWEIFNYDQLMENFNELSEGEQNSMYKILAGYLENNPELSIIQTGIKENCTVSSVTRMYLVQDKKELLGTHALEAWIDARRISIIRWGIGAGYISEQEGYALYGKNHRYRSGYYQLLRRRLRGRRA